MSARGLAEPPEPWEHGDLRGALQQKVPRLLPFLWELQSRGRYGASAGRSVQDGMETPRRGSNNKKNMPRWLRGRARSFALWAGSRCGTTYVKRMQLAVDPPAAAIGRDAEVAAWRLLECLLAACAGAAAPLKITAVRAANPAERTLPAVAQDQYPKVVRVLLHAWMGLGERRRGISSS